MFMADNLKFYPDAIKKDDQPIQGLFAANEIFKLVTLYFVLHQYQNEWHLQFPVN